MERIKREAKRILLSGIHTGEAFIDRFQVERVLKNYDMEPVENKPPVKVKRITFIITRMVRFHGGQTSILRLGTQLFMQGYDVVYAVYKPQSKEEMEVCARSNLKSYKGQLLPAAGLKKLKTDVVVATSYDTVSFAKKIKGYKMYFVQDYEPYFYPFGELFLMAKKTYEQGLHMVSLGNWNKEMVLRECSPISPIDVIDFPYEEAEYPRLERNYSSYGKKKEFTIAVYLKFYGKRLPTIIPYLLTHVQEMFKKDGIEIKVKFFGEAKNFRAKGGENLGMLSKKELLELYEKSDFGMVASLSNISLVPYEMISTGLPVIEFKDGTFPFFFPKDSAILTEISYVDLYNKLKQVMDRPELLSIYHENAMGYMKELSWKHSAEQFGGILDGIKAADSGQASCHDEKVP